MINPPQVRPEEPTAVTPHGGFCGGKSQQWLRYPTNPHAAFDVEGTGDVARHRPKPARQSSTLPVSGVWKRSHGRAREAPPDERGGNRYVRPTATAPHSDSTMKSGSRVEGWSYGQKLVTA